MISTEPAVDTWQTCSREPTWAASRQSRAMIASSGDRRPPGQPEAPRELALVHLRVLGEPRLLRVLGDHPVERLDVLQGPAHQHRVAHALAVVGEHPDRGGGVGHRPELGQPLAAEAHGDRADRPDVAVARLAAQAPDLLDDAGRVGDRLGVGHRVHGGEAAQGGGLRAGLDGLGVLPAGLAEVGVQVDEPGQRDETARVDDLDPLRRLGGRRGDPAVLEEQVLGLATEDAHALDQVVSHSSPPTAGSEPPSSR